MLYNQLSSVLVCSFWVDEGKDSVLLIMKKHTKRFLLKNHYSGLAWIANFVFL